MQSMYRVQGASIGLKKLYGLRRRVGVVIHMTDRNKRAEHDGIVVDSEDCTAAVGCHSGSGGEMIKR